MKRRNRRAAPPRRSSPLPPEHGLPGLEILEEISAHSLAKWRQAGRNLEQFSETLFFGLEARRSRHSTELLDALRTSAQGPRIFDGWARLVDYQYANQPLSMEGSLKGDGGRFNVGRGLDPATHTAFPALYVAEDFATAFRERFGTDQTSNTGGLSAEELVLRRTMSFAQVALNVHAETVMDVGDLQGLKPIAEILSRIQMPPGVGVLSRKLRLRPPGLVRTAAGLQRMLLHPNWRVDPVQYGLPSSPQVFGRLCAAAGIHGILYPSARNNGRQCLALFPQNWRGSGSFVELVGPCPAGTAKRRLDGNCGD